MKRFNWHIAYDTEDGRRVYFNEELGVWCYTLWHVVVITWQGGYK